jgi:hypothetical protein
MKAAQEKIILTALTHVDWVEHESELTPPAPNGKSSIVLAAIILAAEVRRLQMIEEIINEFIAYAREGELGYSMYSDDFSNLKELLK